MANTQQEVLIYKEKMLATAQSQFEKDLRKRQTEGWKLVNVTPTQKIGSRISQLTAIYERDNTADSNNTPPNNQYSVNASGETIPAQSIVEAKDNKKPVGRWSKIKEANRRATEREQEYQSTLNPEQLRKHKRRNNAIGCGTIVIALFLCIGISIIANASNYDGTRKLDQWIR